MKSKKKIDKESKKATTNKELIDGNCNTCKNKAKETSHLYDGDCRDLQTDMEGTQSSRVPRQA